MFIWIHQTKFHANFRHLCRKEDPDSKLHLLISDQNLESPAKLDCAKLKSLLQQKRCQEWGCCPICQLPDWWSIWWQWWTHQHHSKKYKGGTNHTGFSKPQRRTRKETMLGRNLCNNALPCGLLPRWKMLLYADKKVKTFFKFYYRKISKIILEENNIRQTLLL